jgi:hypothetical protein
MVNGASRNKSNVIPAYPRNMFSCFFYLKNIIYNTKAGWYVRSPYAMGHEFLQHSYSHYGVKVKNKKRKCNSIFGKCRLCSCRDFAARSNNIEKKCLMQIVYGLEPQTNPLFTSLPKSNIKLILFTIIVISWLGWTSSRWLLLSLCRLWSRRNVYSL